MKAGKDNYCIIRGSAEPAGRLSLANSMEMAVNERISDGWKALGGISTAVFGDMICMFQAMVKYEMEEEHGVGLPGTYPVDADYLKWLKDRAKGLS